MEELKQYQIEQKKLKRKLEVQKILFENRKIPACWRSLVLVPDIAITFTKVLVYEFLS